MRRASLLAVVACLGALAVLVAPAAQGGNDFECTGTVVGTLLVPQTFDNVVVPPNAVCIMQSVTIRGNAKALENSRFYIRDSRIGGNIDGDKADNVQVVNNEISGSIQIKEGGPSPVGHYEAAVCGNTLIPLPLAPGVPHVRENIQVEKMTSNIGILVGEPSLTVGLPASTTCNGNIVRNGNIKVEENVANGLFRIRNNQIGTNGDGGNLQVFKNTGTASKFVQFNIVSKGVIQCYENTPALMFFGSPNTGRADPSPPNQCTGSP